MNICLFYHSLRSDWNHGNAHFLRGYARELHDMGHDVHIFEPERGWSYTHMLAEQGKQPLRSFHRTYPTLASTTYDPESPPLHHMLEGADLIIVHEWNDPQLVAAIGNWRHAHPTCRLLFHDTHHRSVTDPEAMARYDLSHYDGALVFGKVLKEIYLRRKWVRKAWVWHEGADSKVFRPYQGAETAGDIVWIGNWGDEERTEELHEFMIEPIRQLGLHARVYGVRYPEHARRALAAAGIEYGGWLPNVEVPEVFSQYRLTLHVPRRPYVESLPGIPTIRPFEALACGIPLICSPWDDAEGLFSPGNDYAIAEDGADMTRQIKYLLDHPESARKLASHGRQTVLRHHTCAHRARQLIDISEELFAEPTPLTARQPQRLAASPRLRPAGAYFASTPTLPSPLFP